ncbi:MAG: imidazolonepropionase [Clostridiales bacterium]|nr:imidazolonepropionase [Clostridiales bacterium]
MSAYAIQSDNIVTFEGTSGVTDGFIVVKDGLIREITQRKPLNIPCYTAAGMTVTPGLIDAHTHLVHAGSRENELADKLSGVPYMDILKKGGGILSTVRATRTASIEELKDKARKSLDIMLAHGTTTVEAKSGYGLDIHTELKQLKAAKELNGEHPIDIISTYMGAHAMPPEYKDNRRGYLDLMINEVMPKVTDAAFVDVFCEDGAFYLDETREILQAAKALGFGVKLHADEIEPMGGAELAAELGAVSAEHLLKTSDAGIEALAQAGVSAVLLPATSFYLMTGSFARARDMINAGVNIALATDYNPGSCPTENLQAVMTFAAFGMGLMPIEIIRAMTSGAAKALGLTDRGAIKPGLKADLVIFGTPNIDYIVYHFGLNHVHSVIKDGIFVKGGLHADRYDC